MLRISRGLPQEYEIYEIDFLGDSRTPLKISTINKDVSENKLLYTYSNFAIIQPFLI